ncbi:LysR substrate-binding domain-containing protein [Cupriavidus basilensis]
MDAKLPPTWRNSSEANLDAFDNGARETANRHRGCSTPGQHRCQSSVSGRKESVDIHITPTLQVSEFNVVRQAAIQGIGFAFLPTYMVQQELRDGSLRELFRRLAGSSVRPLSFPAAAS